MTRTCCSLTTTTTATTTRRTQQQGRRQQQQQQEGRSSSSSSFLFRMDTMNIINRRSKKYNSTSIVLFYYLLFSVIFWIRTSPPLVVSSSSNDIVEQQQEETQQQQPLLRCAMGWGSSRGSSSSVVDSSSSSSSMIIIDIPESNINDGYCDCPITGEDEPNTEACSGIENWYGIFPTTAEERTKKRDNSKNDRSFATFRCPEQPAMLLWKSRLNDGICDCCDGMDEMNLSTTKSQCVDICDEVLAEERERIKLIQENYNIGSKHRMEQIDIYTKHMDDTKHNIHKIEADLSFTQKEMDRIIQSLSSFKLNVIKDRLETIYLRTMGVVTTTTSIPTKEIFDDHRIKGLLEGLTDDEIIWLIIFSCQISGEMKNNIEPRIQAMSSEEDEEPTTFQFSIPDGTRTCIPLRLAGVDSGIIWENETYKMIDMMSIENDDERKKLLSEIYHHNVDNEMKVWNSYTYQTAIAAKENNKNKNKNKKKKKKKHRRRRLMEYDDVPPYDDYMGDDDDDYSRGDHHHEDDDHIEDDDDEEEEDMEDDDDIRRHRRRPTAAHRQYQQQQQPSSGGGNDSRPAEEVLDDSSNQVPTDRKGQLLHLIKNRSMTLGRAKLEYIDKTQHVLNKIDELQKSIQEKEEAEAAKAKEEEARKEGEGEGEELPPASEQQQEEAAEEAIDDADDDSNINDDDEELSTSSFDPMSLPMIRNTLEQHRKLVQRGLDFALSAKVLMDSTIEEFQQNDNMKTRKRTILFQLAMMTMYYGQISSIQFYLILSEIVPELLQQQQTSNASNEGEEDSKEETCKSQWADLCSSKPISIERPRNNSDGSIAVDQVPPPAIIHAVQAHCDRVLLDEIPQQEDVCASNFGSVDDATIPKDIVDGYLGYYTPQPRRRSMSTTTIDYDPFYKIFANLEMKRNDIAQSELSTLLADQTRTENDKSDYEDQLDDLRSILNDGNNKYGPDGELYSIRDECFSIDSGKYTYEVCMFKNARQMDQNDNKGRGTDLGKWQEATIINEGDDDDASGNSGDIVNRRIFKWINGAKCWNGPKRSATVYVTCGQQNKIISADEPDTCRYVFEMESYIACDDIYKQKHQL